MQDPDLAIALAVVDMFENNQADFIAQNALAQWISGRYPAAVDAVSEERETIERLSFALLQSGTSVADWLTNFEGRPSLIGYSLTMLREIEPDRVLPEFINKHSRRVYDEVGVGPDSIPKSLQTAIEVGLYRRNDHSILHSTSIAVKAGKTALAAEAVEGGEIRVETHNQLTAMESKLYASAFKMNL